MYNSPAPTYGTFFILFFYFYWDRIEGMFIFEIIREQIRTLYPDSMLYMCLITFYFLPSVLIISSLCSAITDSLDTRDFSLSWVACDMRFKTSWDGDSRPFSLQILAALWCRSPVWRNDSSLHDRMMEPTLSVAPSILLKNKIW